MDLINYCLQILEETHQITLPSLGKFELIFNSVKTDTQTQQTHPPQYEIIFSQQHNLNDENIASIISALEFKDIKKTKIEIIEIISKWKSILKNEGILKLDNFGTLTTKKEKIIFAMSPDCVFNFKNFGLPII